MGRKDVGRFQGVQKTGFFRRKEMKWRRNLLCHTNAVAYTEPSHKLEARQSTPREGCSTDSPVGVMYEHARCLV